MLYISIADRVVTSASASASVSKAPTLCEHHMEFVFSHQAASVQKVSKSLLGWPIASERHHGAAGSDGGVCSIDLDSLVLNEALGYQVRSSVSLLCKRFESEEITSAQLFDGPAPVCPPPRSATQEVWLCDGLARISPYPVPGCTKHGALHPASSVLPRACSSTSLQAYPSSLSHAAATLSVCVSAIRGLIRWSNRIRCQRLVVLDSQVVPRRPVSSDSSLRRAPTSGGAASGVGTISGGFPLRCCITSAQGQVWLHDLHNGVLVCQEKFGTAGHSIVASRCTSYLCRSCAAWLCTHDTLTLLKAFWSVRLIHFCAVCCALSMMPD